MRTVRAISAFLALALAAFTPAVAQVNHTTNVNLQNVLVNGSNVAFGKLCAIATDNYGNPITFSSIGWGVVAANSGFCANVVNGSMVGGLPVPDANQTNRGAPISYTFSLQLTNSAFQSQSAAINLFNNVAGVSGSNFSLDAYSPPTSVVVPNIPNALGSGSGVPSSCVSPAIWTVPGSTPTILVCNNGVYAAASTSVITVVYGTSAGTAMVGNDSRVLSAIKDRGQWSSVVAYSMDDAVQVGTGSSAQTFYSIVPGVGTNTGNAPASTPSSWQQLSGQPGTNGNNGTNGVNGTNGANGAAATVTVVDTTTGTPGTPALVSNTGTGSNAQLHFLVPQGVPGTTGPPGSPGAGATVAIGSVSAGAPGTAPAVGNSGTPQNAVLNFLIPQGQPGAGLNSSSANLFIGNGQVQADSIATSSAYGYISFGDSITAGFGSINGPGYATMIANDYGITWPNNQGVPTERVQDEVFHMFNVCNPGESSNPIQTSMIGTNNASAPSGYQAVHMAGHAWCALSSTNKIMAGSGLVALTGNTAADTTYPNAPGVACTSGTCTATYNGYIGTPDAFYLWYKEAASGAGLSVTVDGVAVTDTVTGAAINTTWPTPAAFQSSTVGLARYYNPSWNSGSTSQHAIVVSFQSGATILGFGFPPTTRYRGVSGPKIVIGGVPPQQNSTNATQVAVVNGYNLLTSKTLVGDGLNAPFADVNNNLDPVLDFAGTDFTASISGSVMTVTAVTSTVGTINVNDVLGTGCGVPVSGYITSYGTGTGGVGTYNLSVSQTVPNCQMTAGPQNVAGASNAGVHPNNRGHRHIASTFESVINAIAVPAIIPNTVVDAQQVVTCNGGSTCAVTGSATGYRLNLFANSTIITTGLTVVPGHNPFFNVCESGNYTLSPSSLFVGWPTAQLANLATLGPGNCFTFSATMDQSGGALYVINSGASTTSGAVPLAGGNMTGPFSAPKINQTSYVVSGGTIQSVVTAACNAGSGRVSIQSGITPSDTIPAVTGCTAVAIMDERDGQGGSATYTWNSTAAQYVKGGAGNGTSDYGTDSRVPSPIATGHVTWGMGNTASSGPPPSFYIPNAWNNQGGSYSAAGVGIFCYPDQATALDAQNKYGSQGRRCTSTDFTNLGIGGGGIPADVSTPSTFGTVNSDQHSNAIVNGVLTSGAGNVWDAAVYQFFLGQTSICPAGNNQSGLMCAAYRANSAWTTNRHSQVIKVHPGTSDNDPMNAIYAPINLPQAAYNQNSISIDCDYGTWIWAAAAITDMVYMPPVSPASGSPSITKCGFDLNHLATGGVELYNAGTPYLDHVALKYIDWQHGNKMSNRTLACIGCSNFRFDNIDANSGNTGHGGGNDVAVMCLGPGETGSLHQTCIVGNYLTSLNITTTPGTAGTAGTYNWTTSAGSATAQRYPSGTITTTGSGWSSYTIKDNGFMITSGTLTMAIAGTPGVSGATITQGFDTGWTGMGTTADSSTAHVVAPITPVFAYGKRQPSTAVFPAVFQNYSSTARPNYDALQAGLLTKTPTITLSTDGNSRVLGVTLADTTVASLGSGLVGPVYLKLLTTNPVYAVVTTNAPDSWMHNAYLLGGIVGLDLLGGGSHYSDIHTQSAVGIRGEQGGLNFIDNAELDSDEISGIEMLYNSIAIITNPQFTYNGPNYPNTRPIYIGTTNSQFNSVITGLTCTGLPLDVADFGSVVGSNGSPDAPGFTGYGFQKGLQINGSNHCSGEPNLTAINFAEDATSLSALGIGYISGEVDQASTVNAVNINQALTHVSLTTAWNPTMAVGTAGERVCIEIQQPATGSTFAVPAPSTVIASTWALNGTVNLGLRGHQCFQYDTFDAAWVGEAAILNY